MTLAPVSYVISIRPEARANLSPRANQVASDWWLVARGSQFRLFLGTGH